MERRNLLQKSVASLVLIGLGLSATGCSLGKKTATPTTTYPQVRVWRYNQDIDSLRDTIEEFEKQYKSTNVKVTYQRHTLDTYEYDALKSAASLKGPDIWSIPSDWIADYQDVFTPLSDTFFQDTSKKNSTTPKPTDAIKDLFPAGVASAINNNGSVIGMPTSVDTLRLYYNPDIFSDALREYRKSTTDEAAQTAAQQLLKHAPRTWNELVDQTGYITQRNGNDISRSAIALGTASNTPNATDILQVLMMQNGVGIVSDDHKTAAFHLFSSTPSGTSIRPGNLALDFFTSFSNPTKKNYTWNESMSNPLDAFGQGKVAMVIAFKGFENDLKSKYPKLSYSTAALPQISTTSTGVNLIKFSLDGVMKTSKAAANSDSASASSAFLKQYTTKSVVKSIAREQKLISPYLADISEDDAIASQVITGKTVYKKNHVEFDRTFVDMINNVTKGSATIDEAIDSAAQRITQLLNPSEPEDQK